MKKLFVALTSFTLSLGLLIGLGERDVDNPVYAIPPPIITKSLPKAKKPEITIAIPAYLSYDGVVKQLREWNKEAPDLTKVGIYGKSSKNRDLYYLRVTNLSNKNKPKILITACIHGNEPLSTSIVMAYIGTILSKYKSDKEITRLINTRDIYFIPVISPDSYPHSRRVDGVDPNRNFPSSKDPNKKSVPPVSELRRFFLMHKFDAVASGHTFGRMFLYPWGEKNQRCPDDKRYREILDEMSRLSRYKMIRACELYNRPIYGTEVDWYYKNGAFAIVIEFGTNHRIPLKRDIEEEFGRTFKSILYFIDNAPRS